MVVFTVSAETSVDGSGFKNMFCGLIVFIVKQYIHISCWHITKIKIKGDTCFWFVLPVSGASVVFRVSADFSVEANGTFAD